jgi:hypothetical protein
MKTIEHSETIRDEILAEVRRHKQEIAAEHSYSVRSLAKDIQQRQQGHPRLVAPPKNRSEQGGRGQPATRPLSG